MATEHANMRDGEVNRGKETHRFPWRREILHDHILRRHVLSNVRKPRMPLCGHLRGIVVVLRGKLDQRLSLPCFESRFCATNLGKVDPTMTA
jgi:hypothetical protein